ncbi:hypothetical protein U1Q18_029288 [Sarracenia purpurea var. burkii]
METIVAHGKKKMKTWKMKLQAAYIWEEKDDDLEDEVASYTWKKEDLKEEYLEEGVDDDVGDEEELAGCGTVAVE